MPKLNVTQDGLGAVMVDDETDKAVSYKVRVRLTEFNEIEIIDMLGRGKVTTGVHIAEGIVEAFDLIFRRHGIARQQRRRF
jgi:hypothetical protein